MTLLQKNWQALIKPEKLGIEDSHDSSRIATMVAEPLERGFGMTLGNAIRRVLLSSLQGAAVTAVQIDGVLHEFSSIPGVREDVTDIVLNIKQLAIRMHGDGPRRVALSATGPGEVTAGQIQAGHDIEILNPDLVLCTGEGDDANCPVVNVQGQQVQTFCKASNRLPPGYFICSTQ